MDPRRRFLLRGAVQSARAAEVPPPPRPPWALPEARFTEVCTRCGDCVRACPRALLSSGDGGFPEIRFLEQGCNFCGDCRQACTPGALDRTPDAAPFPWRVHVAESCLARQRVECRLCADACDVRALRFVPALGGIAQLQVDLQACTGCGDCVPPCPVGATELKVPA